MYLREPDIKGTPRKGCDIFAWRMSLESKRGAHGTVAYWLLRAPMGYFHAFWNRWIVCCVHLRDDGKLAPAKIKLEGATHEIFIAALDPDTSEFDPQSPPEPMPYMLPLDICEQFIVVNDEQAVKVTEMMVQSICDGRASPDQDFLGFWKRQIPVLSAHARGDHHH